MAKLINPFEIDRAETRKIFGESRWIWRSSDQFDLYNCFALFRKTIELPKVPRNAPLCITADQSYQLWVNGQYVARGPARGFQASWPFDEIDLAKFLKPGTNTFAVRAYHPGRSSFGYRSEGTAGLLVAARWGKTQLVSDRTWKSIRQEHVKRGTIPMSLQLFDQEHIDLRAEPNGWTQPGFDDSAWKNADTTGVFDRMPWYAMERRGIPMLRETPMGEPRVIASVSGTSGPGYESERNISRLIHGELAAATYTASNSSELPPTSPGAFSAALIDFGKTVIGSLELVAENTLGGEIFDVQCVEAIDPASFKPSLKWPEGCFAAMGVRMVARAGRSAHSFYHPIGFRYALVIGRGLKQASRVGLGVRSAVYPLEITGAFKSSDEDLNRIWQTSAWTQQVCMMDAYVDTPWREQAQWWGDARVQAANTFYLSGDTRLFRRGIHCIANQRTPEGLTYGHSPTIAHGCVLPDFTLIWMLTLWDFYWQTGSIEPFATHEPVVREAFTYFEKWIDKKSGLLTYDPRYWLFLDWTRLQKEGQSTLYSLWLLIALRKMSALYTLKKDPKQAARLRKWADTLRSAIDRLRSPQGLLFDGVLPDGKRNKHCSVHVQTLAILSGEFSKQTQAMLEKSLLPLVRDELNDPVTPSSYWITYCYTALDQLGHGEAVVNHIRKHWKPMADHGTTWEGFNPSPGGTSLSHAWSAHPVYHLMQIIGGIRQTSPGWKSIEWRPTRLLDRVQIKIPTPLGMIEARWDNQGDPVLTTPKGMKVRKRT